MRGTALAFNRFLALLLSFILGFMSFAGVLVGAGYVVYAHLSIDTLNKFGANINTEEFLDPDAEKPLTSMTIKGLVEEIKLLATMGEEVNLDMLIERYGLILDEETMAYLSEELRSLPLSQVFGPDGATVLLSTVTVAEALALIPGEVISEPMLESMRDKTLADIVEMKLGYLFEGVELGYILGVKYEKNEETGEYEIVYAVEDSPTFMELLSRLDLGKVMTSVEEGNLDLMSLVEDNFGDLTVIIIAESFSGSETKLPGFLADKKLEEIITEENGAYKIDVQALLGEAKLGEILSYHYDVDTDKWYEDAEFTVAVEGIYANICDVPVYDLISPPLDEDGNQQTQVDILLGSLGGTLGEMMGYYKDETDGKWYLDDGTVGDERTEADALYSALCEMEISDLLNGEDPSQALIDAFESQGTTLGSLMGYTYVDDTDDGIDNGVWQAKSGEEADALFAALCGVALGELLDSDNPSDVIMGAFEDEGTTLGDIMGYTYVDDTDDGIDNGVWQAKSGEEADALFAALCGVGIYELMNSDDASDVIMGAFEDEGTTLGDIMGYTYVDDTDDGIDNGVWQAKSGEEADALFAALCGVGIYELMNSDNASDVIMGAFEDEGTTLGDIMGYKHVDNTDDGIDNPVWQTESGVEADALFAALCTVTLYELMEADDSSEVIRGAFDENNVLLGDVMGYDKAPNPEYSKADYEADPDNYDVLEYLWYDKDGNEITGISAKIAEYKLTEIMDGGLDTDELLDDVTVAEIYGLERDEKLPVYVTGSSTPLGEDAPQIPLWIYTDTGEAASGIISTLAGLNINQIDEALDNLEIADVIGLVYYQAEGAEEGGFYSWEVKEENGERYVELTPDNSITGEFADLTLDQISNGGIDERVKTVEIGKFVGYYEKDGKWYTDEACTIPASGILGAIAGATTETLEDDIKNVEIGTFVGYYEKDGEWYTDEACTIPATGILGAIAGSTTKTLEEDIEKIEIGTFVGYYEKDGKWYTDEACTIPASGILGAIAGSTTGTIESDIEDIEIGTFVGYYEKDGKWYTDEACSIPASGILGAIAGSTTGTIESDIDDIEIGTFVGYYEKDGKWYTDEACTTPASGILGAIAGSTTGTIESDIDDIEIGTFVGYYEKDGKWYTDEACTIPASGILGAIAGSTSGSIEEDIKTIAIGRFMGYYERDGKWYTDKECTNPVEGIMGAIAGYTSSNLESGINSVKVAQIVGYYEKDGDWYTDEACTIPASGILGAIAGLTIDDFKNEGTLSDTMKNVEIGDLMGYEKKADGWYQNGSKVTGIMAAIADSTATSLDADIKTIKIADVLGYEERADGWYQNGSKVNGIMATIADKEVGNLQNVFDETLMGELLGYEKGAAIPGGGYQWHENGTLVHVLMNKVANCKFDELGSLTSTLTIADLIAEEDRQSGYISLVSADATLEELPAAVNEIFVTKTIGELVEAGVITDSQGNKIVLDDYTASLTINELITFIATNGGIVPTP